MKQQIGTKQHRDCMALQDVTGYSMALLMSGPQGAAAGNVLGKMQLQIWHIRKPATFSRHCRQLPKHACSRQLCAMEGLQCMWRPAKIPAKFQLT